MFSQSIIDQIRDYGQKYGRNGVEIGGAVSDDGSVVMAENLSTHSFNNYLPDKSYFPRNVMAEWHTHPGNSPYFSEGDIKYSRRAGVPEILYCPDVDVMKVYYPDSDSTEDINLNTSALVPIAPFQLTESHQNKILQLADRYGYNNQEIAGIITPSNEVEMLPNLAADPTNHFQIDWGNEPVAAIWHTHLPHHPAQLSEEDISESDRLGLPYVMFHVGQQAWDFYQPQTQQRQAISTLKFKYVPNKRDLIAEAARYQKEIQKANATIKKHNDRLQKEWQAASQQALKIISASNSKIDRRLSQISASRANTNRHQSRAKLLAEEFSRLRD